MSRSPSPSYKKPGEQARFFGPRLHQLLVPVPGKLLLDGVPGLSIDDGRVLTGITLALVVDLARVERVREDAIEVPAAERVSADHALALARPELRPKPSPIEFALQGIDRFEFEIQPIDRTDCLGLDLVDGERAVLGFVADRHEAAHP